MGEKKGTLPKGKLDTSVPNTQLHVYQNFRSTALFVEVVVLCVSNVLKNSYYKIALFVPVYKDLK